VGGGSSFGGFAFPFVQDKLAGRADGLRIIAVEPTACPSLTKGRYLYDFGDTAGTTPLLKMYTLGHSFVPAPIHAGGLRYHGMAPLVCVLYDHTTIQAVAVPQTPVFAAAVQFAQAEGIVPAPEPAHAIRVVIDEAIRCRERGERKTIAFVLCGHGHFDLGSYERYLRGQLEDYELPQSEIERALSLVPQV
jgi:predicted alternative tryptophan synthase beta-subunit